MFNKKYLFVLLLLAVAIGTVASVSASDANQTDAVADSADAIDEIASVDEANDVAGTQDDTVLADGEKDDGIETDQGESSGDDAPIVIATNKAKSATISASSATKYFKDTKKAQITVKSGGKAVSGVTVRVKIFTGSACKTIAAKTNSKGVATYTIPAALKTGKHKVTFEIVGTKYTAKKVTKYITVKPRPLYFYTQYITTNGVKGFISVTLDKLTKKYPNGIKLKVLINNNGRWLTKYLTTGYEKSSKLTGVTAYVTNMLTVGTHLVKIMPATKDYTGSKLTKLIITKNAKIYYKNWAIYLSGGKTYTVVNGKTYVQ